MELKGILATALVGLSVWGVTPGSAQAGTVLYDSSGVIEGAQSFTQALSITTPGTLTVSLTTIPWLDTISGLSGFVSSSTSVLGSTAVGGNTIVAKVQPGTLYTHWFGDADGAYGYGVYGIEVTFQPSNSSTSPNGPPVPLPGTLVLLLSALGVLLGWQARRPPAARNDALLPAG